VLVVRYLFGFRGPVLVAGALGDDATRTDPAAIAAELDGCVTTLLDVDDNESTGALNDGILILRRLLGASGPELVDSAVGPGCGRCDPPEIEEHIDGYVP